MVCMLLFCFEHDYGQLLTLLFRHVFQKLKCIVFIEHVSSCLFEAGIINGLTGLSELCLWTASLFPKS